MKPRMKKLFFIIFVGLLMMFVGCSSNNDTNNNTSKVTLRFIETTDMHGSIFPYDFIEGEETETSLSQIYTYVKSQRSVADQEVVLLDAGDILQGQPIANYYNFERDNLDGHVIADAMNYMKYDVATVGNHDIEPGKAVYDAVKEQLSVVGC